MYHSCIQHIRNSFLVPHPSTKQYEYGLVPVYKSGNITFPEAPVLLKLGSDWKNRRGYGVRHIWAGHKGEIEAAGIYSEYPDESLGMVKAVSEYVATIVSPGVALHSNYENSYKTGVPRVIVLKRNMDHAVVEYREEDEEYGPHYSIITAYKIERPQGPRIGTLRPFI